MFILDSLFLSGFRWVLDTVATTVDAERNDDTALREQLLEAEFRRETGEISDEEFSGIETDLLARIREIRERREGGSGPIAFSGQPMEATPDTRFEVEATVTGEFHQTNASMSGDPSGTVIRGTLLDSAPAASGSRTSGTDRTNRTDRTDRTDRTNRTKRTKRTIGTTRTSGTSGTTRTARTSRTSRTSRTTRTPPRS